MKINDFVLVTDKDSELYRRRCRITACSEAVDGSKLYTIYIEGFDQTETVTAEVLKLSEF